MRIVLACILISATFPAAAGELPAVAVQAVAPTGDGRAKVAECSGVLIASDLVLTAGHCLDAISKPSQVAAFAYEGDRPRPKPLLVAAFARHPGHVIGWREKAGDPETRRNEIAADLALLRLAEPVAGVTPAVLAGAAIAAAPPTNMIAGAGASGPGQPSGRMKQSSLTSVRLATGGGPTIAFATASATVCGGDSGGPVAAPSGVWGVVAAVIRGARGCGQRIVIAPVDPASEGFRRMRAEAAAR